MWNAYFFLINAQTRLQGIKIEKDYAAAKGMASDERDAVLIMKMAPLGGPYIVNAITPWRGVRTKRYTYANLFDHGPWLLYDHHKDP